MLFAVLSEGRGGLTKAEAVAKIRERRWFEFQPEDWEPYPSQEYTTREPRWMTVIAWARKDAVKHGLIHPGPFNNWDLTTEGLNSFLTIAKGCREGCVKVRRCYLWSPQFKLRMDPSYTIGQPEDPRPHVLYWGDWFRELAIAE
jgi:hypothetical protein